MYGTISRIIVENQHRTMRNLMDYAYRYLSMVQDDINSVLLAVAANERLWDLPLVEVERSLEVYAGYLPLFEKLYILKTDGTIVGYPQSSIRSLGHLAVPYLLREFEQTGDGIHYSEPYLSPLSHWTVSIGVPVLTRNGARPGIVAVDIPLILFKDILPWDSLKSFSAFFLITDHGSPVFADHENRILSYSLNTNTLVLPDELMDSITGLEESYMFDLEIAGEKYTCLTGKTLDHGRWRPVVLMPWSQVLEARRSVILATGQLFLFVALASTVIAWLVARRFAKPLELLSGEMERVQAGSLHGIEVPKRNDEIERLSISFNNMMDRIRTLIEDLRQSERERADAEMRVLQAQVNPHFLYNTLNAVAHSSSLSRQDDVYEMISSLTHILSFSLEKTSKMVLLAHELEVIGHCINLMRISMGRDFELRYEIQPGLGRCLIPKLILQPIVENAIFHGFSGNVKNACLLIWAERRDDLLMVQVIDNGKGLDSEGVYEQPPHGRIGLKSIRERLALLYDDGYRLTLESHDPTGVKVTILLPFHVDADERQAESGQTQ